MRRKLFWVIGLSIVILAIGAVMAPGLIVKGWVLGRINEAINGKVTARDWSAGWTSGVTFRDLKLDDASGNELVTAGEVQTGLSVWQAIRGKLQLGQVRAQAVHFHAKVNADGSHSFTHLLKPAGTGARPEVTGTIQLNGSGTIDTPDNVAVTIDAFSGSAKLTGLDQPVEHLLVVKYQVGSQCKGNGEVHGVVTPGDNWAATETVRIEGLELATSHASGTLHGEFTLVSGAQTDFSGKLVADGLALRIKGDEFRTASATVTLKGSHAGTRMTISEGRVELPEGTIEIAGQTDGNRAGKLKTHIAVTGVARVANALRHTLGLAEGVEITGGTIVQDVDATWTGDSAGGTAKGRFELKGKNRGRTVAIEPVTLALSATGKRTAGQTWPTPERFSLDVKSVFATLTGEGASLASLRLTGDFDLDKLLGQLTQFVDTGNVKAAGTGHFELITAGADADGVDAKIAMNLDGIRVTGLPSDISEPKLVLSASARLAKGAAGPDDIRNLAVRLESRSGVIEAHGQTLAAMDVTGDLDLGKLTEQAGPLIGLKGIEGRARIKATTRGDVTKSAGPISADIGVEFDGLTAGRIHNAAGAANATGTIERTGAPDIRDIKASLRIGTKESPSMQFDGTGDLDLAAKTATRLEISKLVIDVDKAASDVDVTPAWVPAIGNETLTIAGTGTFSWEHGVDAKASALTISSSDGLVSLKLAEPTSLQLRDGQAPEFTGVLELSGDAHRLLKVGQAWWTTAGNQPELTQPGARVEGRLSVSSRGTDKVIESKLNLTHVTSPPYFNDAAVKVAVNGTAAADWSAANFTGTVDAGADGVVTLSNAKVVLKGRDGWGRLEKLDLSLDNADAAAVLAMTGATPIKAERGKLSAKASLIREAETTTLRVPSLSATGTLLKNAAGAPLLDGNIFAGGTATIDSANTGEVRAVRLADLHATLADAAELAITSPVEIKDLTLPQPTISGGIKASGKTPAIVKWIEATSGARWGDLAGDYVATETLSTSAGKIRIAGSVALTNFEIRGDAKPLVADPKIDVTNDVELDLTQRVAAVNSFKISMSSGTASVDVKGRLIDWAGQRTLDGAHVDLDYDLAKTWNTVRPALPADWQETLKDIKMDGKHRAGFDVRGALPAGLDSANTLTIAGTLTAGAIDYKTYAVRDLTLPVLLQNGVLRTVGADGRLAEPAKFNDGKLDLGDATLDCNGANGALRITLPRNKTLITDATVNPALADDALKWLCPIFAATRETTGKASVTVVECTNLEPAELTKPGASARGQKLELMFSASDLRLTSGFTDAIGKVADPAVLGQTGSIKDAKALIQDGGANQEATWALPAANEISLKGTVRLTDGTFMPMTASVTKALLPGLKGIDPKVTDAIGPKLDLPLTGDMTNPTIPPDAVAKSIQAAQSKVAASNPAPVSPGVR